MGRSTSQNAAAFDRGIASLTVLSLLCVYLLPSQSGASFSTYLLAVLVVLGGSDRWREFFAVRAVPLLLIGLLLYFSSSVWWSQAPSARGAFSIYSRCVLIVAFAVALATSICRIPQMARWLPRVLAIAAAIAASAALVDFRLHPTWDARLTGLGQLRNSVVAGFAFSAGLMFASSVALDGGAAWRVMGVVCAALTGAAVFATGSRAAYLSVAIGLWTLLWAWRGSSIARWTWWLAVPALIVGAALATLTLCPACTDVLFPRGSSFRLAIWAAEWQRLMDNGLWFGLGVLVPDDVVLDGQLFVHPHSLYLSSALQGGLVGLLLLLAVLLFTGFNLYRARRQEAAPLGLALLTAGMSGYLFDGWELIDKVSVSWLLLWMPLGIAVGVTSKMQNQNPVAGTSPRQRSIEPIEAQP